MPINRTSVDPRVTIAIVSYNTKNLLLRCLDSVFRETSAFPIEVIVIDNDSRDGSCESVRERYKQVTLIENKSNLGFAAATNQGFRLARGEYSLMLNSDTEIFDRAIERTVEFADSHPEAAGIGCRLVYPDGRFQNSCFRTPNLFGIVMESFYLSQLFKSNYVFNWNRYGRHDQYWKSYRQVDCVMGSYILLRNSMLGEVGVLDPDYFMYGEETDLCYRIGKAGGKIFYFPGATVMHVHGGSNKNWADKAWSFIAVNRGTLYFLYKWKRLSAYFGNLIITILMVPRLAFWALSDLKSSLKTGKFEKMHLLKGKGFPFHVKAVFRPSALSRKWGR